MERWTEARLLLDHHPDDALLVEVARPLIESLASRILRWHHAWEPDLWIRIQWRDGEHQRTGMETMRLVLDRAQKEGRIGGWSFEVYDAGADATMMGEEMNDVFHEDMQRGSLRAMRLIDLERKQELTKDRDFHWARITHTTTNQLYGTWAAEYRLCLEQARYRAWLLSHGKRVDRTKLRSVVERLDALIAEVDAIGDAEEAQLDAWRKAGRPEITEMFELPGTFSRKPSDNR